MAFRPCCISLESFFGVEYGIMENNRTKKTLPAEVVFAKGLSCTCPSGRIIMQSQCALQLQQCGCITCNIMQPFWGPNLTKQVQTGSVDLQMTHLITAYVSLLQNHIHLSITWAQSRKHRSAQNESSKTNDWDTESLRRACRGVEMLMGSNLEHPPRTINTSTPNHDTWSKFEECSRRQLNCILFKTWEFENAWNALHTSAQPSMLNPRHAFFNYFSACAGASRSRSITGKFRSPGNIWKPKYLG